MCGKLPSDLFRARRAGPTPARNYGAKTPPLYWLLSIWLISLASCQKNQIVSPENSNTKHPTVASLVPAATDLIVQMGLSDHLVGISNYDNAADLHLTGLPRVGDYQAIDWERLAEIRPDILVIFEAPSRVPAGLSEHANSLHIQLVNVRTETMTDIIAESRRLGMLLNEKTKAEEALTTFQTRLHAIRKRTSKLPKVRTLLVLDPSTLGVVGAHNFLNDALQIAGGQNVIQATGWPSIDREMLQSLKPQVIVALIAEQTPQAMAEAQKFLDEQNSPTCRSALIARWYAQQSSFSVADIAEELADILHPRPATLPTSGMQAPTDTRSVR
ncbi:MAG TPA: ABC transporter substrate-binding protein [Tepidisphaeraceae bacterium]